MDKSHANRATICAALLLAAALLGAGCAAPPADTGAQVDGGATIEPSLVTFAAADGGIVEADDYLGGDAAILLVHGGRFSKESWTNQAREFSRLGFRVLAINLRGRGNSTGPEAVAPYEWTAPHDVQGAVSYLRSSGSASVFAVGGSMGGHAVAELAAADADAFDGIVVLGAVPDVDPGRLSVPKLYIMASRDVSGSGPRLPPLLDHFNDLPDPKSLTVLDAEEHAQHLFGTVHGPRVMRDIVEFISDGGSPGAISPESGWLTPRVTRFMDQYLTAIKRGDPASIASYYAAAGASRFVNGRRRVSSRAQLESMYGSDRWSAPHHIEWASFSVDSVSATQAIVSGTLNWFADDSAAALPITYAALVDINDGILFEHEAFAVD